eukprot:TRINITY_DN7058_c0_g1_i1.p1 TRINITY_DN7058_c0_g1~~TRINITY_DN7058_c0_g1_i1.p1  ORF type:complete len:82 (-),score=20.20 TRINITY_DN7058_c0_g1_i1:91-336(-)
MPKEVKEIKQFLLLTHRDDAKSVKIIKSKRNNKGGHVTKFKVRCSRYLYTLCVADESKADRIKKSLIETSDFEVTDLNDRK